MMSSSSDEVLLLEKQFRDIYLDLLEERRGLKSDINSGANTMLRAWEDSLMKGGVARAIKAAGIGQIINHKRFGLNPGKSFDNILIYFLGVYKLGENGKLGVLKTKKLSAKVSGEDVAFVVRPSTRQSDGYTDYHQKPPVIYMNLSLDDIRDVLEDAFGVDFENLYDGSDPVRLNSWVVYPTIERWTLLFKDTAAHELEHYFQIIREMGFNQVERDYKVSALLKDTKTAGGATSEMFPALAFYCQQLSPPEAEARLQGAYKLYQYYHKKLDFFIVGLMSHFKMQMTILKDVLSGEVKPEDLIESAASKHPYGLFVYLWTTLCFAQNSSRKKSFSKALADSLERYHDLLFDELETSQEILETNYNTIQSFFNEVEKYNFDGFDNFLFEVFDMDTWEFMDSLFSYSRVFPADIMKQLIERFLKWKKDNGMSIERKKEVEA